MPAESQKKFSEILKTLSQENETFPVLIHDGTEREVPLYFLTSSLLIILSSFSISKVTDFQYLRKLSLTLCRHDSDVMQTTLKNTVQNHE